MAEVSLIINNRTYGIACDDGQERRVRDLGHYIDQRMREIARGSGAVGESHLFVLTALVLADELFDLHEALRRARAEGPAPAGGMSEDEERMVSDAIRHLGARIDSLAGRLEKA